jgi:hypothetical protein
MPNGLRYPLVGGTRQRYFIGIKSKPRKLLKNAPSPTSRVHAVLARSEIYLGDLRNAHTVTFVPGIRASATH